MKRKPAKKAAPKKAQAPLYLHDEMLAQMRLDCVRIAAGLAEPEPPHGGMSSLQGGYPGRPGKSSDKVIVDAGKLVAFITQKRHD